MTREEVTAQITAALAGAGKTAPKMLIAALNAALHFIEDSATQPAASPVAGSDSTESVRVAAAAPPDFLLLAGQCADELDEAIALKVGVMDSESKAHAIASQRVGAMQAVAIRLREAAQA